jgi:CheY-like chemotaxis protein
MTRLLLIEDEETSRETTLIALRQLGITDVTTAADGEQGLKMLDSMATPPDIVITDVLMPNKDGIEIVAALVARKYKGGLILVSGGDPTLIKMARLIATHGGIHLLATLLKPVDSSTLKFALQRLCP